MSSNDTTACDQALPIADDLMVDEVKSEHASLATDAQDSASSIDIGP